MAGPKPSAADELSTDDAIAMLQAAIVSHQERQDTLLAMCFSEYPPEVTRAQTKDEWMEAVLQHCLTE